MAVVATMPKASISTAVAVNPGDLRSCRTANSRSNKNFCIRLLTDTVIRLCGTRQLGTSHVYRIRDSSSTGSLGVKQRAKSGRASRLTEVRKFDDFGNVD